MTLNVLMCVPEPVTGPAVAVLTLASGLQQKNVRVRILTGRLSPKYRPFFRPAEEAGAEVVQLRSARGKLRWIPLLARVLRELRSTHLFHAHDLRSCGLAGLLVKVSRKPVVLSLGGDPDLELALYRVGRRARIVALVLWKLSRMVADVICPCSEWLGQTIGERHPEVRPKVRPLHYPVRPLDVRVERQMVVLALARLHPVKGLDVLIRAFERVASRLPDIRLKLCGEGEDKPRLMELADKLGIKDRVEFAGFDAEARALGECAVLAMPSFYEPLGQAILEAMSLGKPVVASRVGGIPEVVSDGETGFLVEPGNVEELAEALLKALDEGVGSKLGANAKRASERFKPEVVAEKYLAIYRELLRR